MEFRSRTKPETSSHQTRTEPTFDTLCPWGGKRGCRVQNKIWIGRSMLCARKGSWPVGSTSTRILGQYPPPRIARRPRPGPGGGVIVVHTLSRLGRTVRDTLNLIHDRDERGLGVWHLACSSDKWEASVVEASHGVLEEKRLDQPKESYQELHVDGREAKGLDERAFRRREKGLRTFHMTILSIPSCAGLSRATMD